MRYRLFLLLLFPAKAMAQQEAQLLLYNIGFGGIAAGVGAICNKPKQANWKRTFVRGFWQGSIGGALHYSGKKTLYLITRQQNTVYGLPAMLLHAAGNSVIENAAYNRRFLQSWNLNYGAFRFDVSFTDQVSFRARLLPAAIFGTILAAPNGRPDWSTSLLTGCILFKTDKVMSMGGVNKQIQAGGTAFGRSIAYTTIYGQAFFHETIAHELVHYFQFNEYQVFNTWMAPLAEACQWPRIRKLFTGYIYADAPYLILPYTIEGNHNFDTYYRNFFEMEAQRFATNKDIPH